MTLTKNLSVYLTVLATLSLSGCPTEQNVISSTPKQALMDFYTGQRAEDQLMDPLILSGVDVVPLLLPEISKKDLPRRRYAIGALGNIQDKSAIPTLQNILGDEAEKDYFRCDALNSIGMIDFQRGKELAESNRESTISCLSQLSDEMLTTDHKTWLNSNYMRRTKQDALSGRHD